MDIHKAFEEAILRAKEFPNLTSENQAQLFGLHQQAAYGDFTPSGEAGAYHPDHVNAWKQNTGLTPDEARQQYIKYVSELTKRRAE